MDVFNVKEEIKDNKKSQEYKGSCSGGDQDMDVTTIVYNSYYQVLYCFQSFFTPTMYFQWVPLYLIFNALLFYCPRLCWLSMEGGLMKFFGKGTTTRCTYISITKKKNLNL